ncbi:MAG TPA: helix-turn-helix domain-containing protein [Candidatus Nitrosotenuis sp.]|nr:helix-turn-helix domain-containing protein [Candidatus Nitrosotenuis sp.]
MVEKLLAPKDAAAMLGVTTARVQQLAREGKLPEIRDSAGRRLFRLEDVERLKHERERQRLARMRTN